MTMYATVCRVQCWQLLVCDHRSCQTVLVRTPDACQFRCGDQVCIEYSGAMTMSIPPQISAARIVWVSSCRGRRRRRCC